MDPSFFNALGTPRQNRAAPHPLPSDSYRNCISADASQPRASQAPVSGHGLHTVTIPPTPYHNSESSYPPVLPSSYDVPAYSAISNIHEDRKSQTAWQPLHPQWSRNGGAASANYNTQSMHQNHGLPGASQHLHSGWPIDGTPVEPWMAEQYQSNVPTDTLGQLDLAWSFGENATPLSSLPPDPLASHAHTDFEYLHHHQETQGHDRIPQYTKVPNPYARSTIGKHDSFPEGGVGLPVVLDELVWDGSDRTLNAGGQPAAVLAPQKSFDPDQIDTSAEPSSIAPVAQMQSSKAEVRQVPYAPSKAAYSTVDPKGKLVFLEVDNEPGVCESVSKGGKGCVRAAPRFKVINGRGERVCLCLSKHLDQWRRAHALPPSFKVIPMTLEQAKKEVYPDHKPFDDSLLLEDASLATEGNQQMKWQKRFIEAAMTVYDGDNKKLRDHQTCFEGNAEVDDEDHYTHDQVNARMILLFYAARNLHKGGERVYACHGDNGGYSKEKRRLSLLQRLETIERLLRTNKRIVMDVIQGRGVLALADNPIAYSKRKNTNNTNNEAKKRTRPDDEDGDSHAENDDSTGTPTWPVPKQRKPAKQATPREKKAGNGKEKAVETPITKKPDPRDAKDEGMVDQPAVTGAPPALTSGELPAAGPCSAPLPVEIPKTGCGAAQKGSLLDTDEETFPSSETLRSWLDSGDCPLEDVNG